MKFKIKSRWSDRVIFEADIECEDSASEGIKLGLAVRLAVKSDAVLRGAYLRGANLGGAYLSDAVLSGAVLRGADLRGADLRGADLGGAVLRGADLGGADLRGAYLRDANLVGADLGGAVLRGADLGGADLRGAYLVGADLRNTYLSGAVLRGADLVGADLGGAVLSDVPKIPNIHQAVFAAASAPAALDMKNWHTTDACGTTHCRAGWVIALAGDGGRALEWALGTPAAAAIIYIASDPKLEQVPDFYCDNETALADMERMAKEEAARAVETAET